MGPEDGAPHAFMRKSIMEIQMNRTSANSVSKCQLKTKKNGPISDADARAIAAECANNAAYTVLVGMTEPTPPPLYTLCSDIRNKYRELLNDAIEGSRVRPMCDPKTKPVVFGVDAPF
ncbi:hypothetical protein [Cystobacter fuscus]|uniref:hypothetical protein n=1 Tax=Cystobacter fuscus TaxID=43 RepID=UPI0012FDFC67|nr:hypothetical protein [Cystobacter fuscus]